MGISVIRRFRPAGNIPPRTEVARAHLVAPEQAASGVWAADRNAVPAVPNLLGFPDMPARAAISPHAAIETADETADEDKERLCIP
jgi:hypothetical protein